jgi:hypothetical protein
MTPHPATNTLTPAPRFSELAISAPQIENMARVTTTSPWLFSALEQVREIEKSGELVPGLGDFRVQPSTGTRVRKLLSSIEVSYLPAPLVAPVSGGGLSITWSIGDKEVKLAVEPNGTTSCFKFENDEMLDDPNEEVTASAPVVERLRWMISRKG